ncbi:tudor domain-containing protein [Phthorimaea operculella]|nr:tudor domain-containing protein [Phthorimaea operculella]
MTSERNQPKASQPPAFNNRQNQGHRYEPLVSRLEPSSQLVGRMTSERNQPKASQPPAFNNRQNQGNRYEPLVSRLEPSSQLVGRMTSERNQPKASQPPAFNNRQNQGHRYEPLVSRLEPSSQLVGRMTSERNQPKASQPPAFNNRQNQGHRYEPLVSRLEPSSQLVGRMTSERNQPKASQPPAFNNRQNQGNRYEPLVSRLEPSSQLVGRMTSERNQPKASQPPAFNNRQNQGNRYEPLVSRLEPSSQLVGRMTSGRNRPQCRNHQSSTTDRTRATAPASGKDDEWEESPAASQPPPAFNNRQNQGNRYEPLVSIGPSSQLVGKMTSGRNHQQYPSHRQPSTTDRTKGTGRNYLYLRLGRKPRPDQHERGPRPDHHDRGPKPDHHERGPRPDQPDRGPRPGWKGKGNNDSRVGQRLRQAAEAASADAQNQRSFSVQDRLRRDNRFNNQNNDWKENKDNDWGNKNRPDRRDNRGDRQDNWGEKKDFQKREFRDNNRERGDRTRSNFTPRDRADRSFGSDDKRSEKSFKSQGSGGAGRAPPYKSRSKFTAVQYKELSDPVPLETPFGEPIVEAGAQHEVSVTWIISPESFYTQILTLQPKFLEMMHSIPELYKGVKSYTGIVPVGASVLARYPADGVLYRAEVVSVQPFSKFIVRYVDFGNKQLVDAKDIWQLDKQLMELPKMAVHCSLLGVAPKDGEWKANPEIDLCFNAPRYQCVFQECGDEGQWKVYLWNNSVSVADTLVEKQLAVSSDHQASVALKDEAIDLTIIVGQQILCKVTHVKSFEEFYVQLDLDKAALVESAIDNFDTGKLTPLTKDSLTDGVHCTVRHDGKIYRAILEDTSDPNKIQAVLPDYGFSITTELANVSIQQTSKIYRAILEDTSDPNKIQAVLPDYGFSITTELANLTPLTKDSLTDGVHCTVRHEGKIYRAILEDTSDPNKIQALTPLTKDSLTDGVHCTVRHEGKIYRAILEDTSDPNKIQAVLPDYGFSITTELANVSIQQTSKIYRAILEDTSDPNKIQAVLPDYGFSITTELANVSIQQTSKIYRAILEDTSDPNKIQAVLPDYGFSITTELANVSIQQTSKIYRAILEDTSDPSKIQAVLPDYGFSIQGPDW